MPQPEVCSSEGDADSQLAMSDTQSEPSSEEMGELSSNASLSPTAKTLKLRGPSAPPANPLQFIKVKPPTNMYVAAPVEKPVVERIRKEEPEDWQNDLDGWKANRRKRQEQLMERVSEIKKVDEGGVGSRKSKTFSEMMKGRKHSLLVYDDDNEINFSELGLGSKKKEQQSADEEEEEEEEEQQQNNNLPLDLKSSVVEKSEYKDVETTVQEKKSESPKVQEYTYEKAIQNYADFASSRVSTNKTPEPAAAVAPKVQPPPIPASPAPSKNILVEAKESPIKINNNKYVATAVREVKVVTETIVMSDSDDFVEAEDFLEAKELAPRLEVAPKVAAPIIKSSVIKRISSTGSVLSKTEVFNNNNTIDFGKAKHAEPSVIASSLSISSTSHLQNVDIKPITDKISHFEKSIEVSVLHNPPSKKLRPPVPCKPPKSAPPPPPICLPPSISPKVVEEAHIPLSPTNSCGDVVDSGQPISDLPRALSPRDRSPMGGEDSGVHTADSVSQSDEVDEEDPTAPVTLSSDLLGMMDAPIVDHELSALLAPPTKMEPPREKPPPPPPVGAVDDTDTMRKCFLGLDITKPPPSVPPPIPPPTQSNEKKDEIMLSNQLKEKLLKLEEEKNNVINLEKKVHAERLPQIVQEYNLSAQERLAAEREALRLEREILQQAKMKQQHERQESISFAKKLAMRSLESLDIPPEAEGRETPPDAYVSAKNSPLSGSPLKPRHQQPDYANLPEQQHLRKAQSEEHVQKQERTYVNQAFFQPPQPRYSSIYEDPYNYDKQEPVVFRKKQGPPPPIKPQARHSTSSALLQRNYSADSILESIEGDAPPAPRHEPVSQRASMPLSNSMSQLPHKQPPSQQSQQPQLKSQRPRSSGGLGLANYHQHWLVQEAEHRRITEQQQRQAAKHQQPKHLPDAIIMSLTQRVQQRQSSQIVPQRSSPQRSPPQRTPNSVPQVSSMDDKVLSVSGKKKCSHCNLELGRGAAMIIESLRLFYHIDCFKCCVCCIQLGDGLMGTDVRVRNGKLHCHSCYSSDDGVKFSCV